MGCSPLFASGKRGVEDEADELFGVVAVGNPFHVADRSMGLSRSTRLKT